MLDKSYDSMRQTVEIPLQTACLLQEVLAENRGKLVHANQWSPEAEKRFCELMISVSIAIKEACLDRMVAMKAGEGES